MIHGTTFGSLKYILRYVFGIIDHGLQLHVSSTSQRIAYTDADWAGFPVTLSCSSVKSKYRGVANVVVETVWVRNLLRALHAPLFTATLLNCDNVSAVYLSTNPVQHQCTTHIEIDIHFVRDFVASGQFVFFMFLRGFSMLISLPRVFQVLYFLCFTSVCPAPTTGVY
ncbi:ribonuclease H-like domain-containing protein [Tanacetum coccineum]|uniref:Ribonuclease H-like domain-containing protein n=1 Tax=Tanacetum coccineum TaxID=301880 RepID=A0ABQ5HJ46_9ASTR